MSDSVKSAMRFLIVDDFATMRGVVRTLLKQIGYAHFDEAVDGREALSKLRSHDFDFVVSDINMPNMDGFALLESVRADSQLCKLPMLMITAEARKEDIVRAVRSGASGFIVKPFTRATLEQKLDRILARLEEPSGIES